MALTYYQQDHVTGLYRKVVPPVDITHQANRLQPLQPFGKPAGVTRSAIGGTKKSQYKGVCYRGDCPRPWMARIKVKKIMTIIGYYLTGKEAAIAYDMEAIKHGRKTNILKKAS